MRAIDRRGALLQRFGRKDPPQAALVPVEEEKSVGRQTAEDIYAESGLAGLEPYLERRRADRMDTAYLPALCAMSGAGLFGSTFGIVAACISGPVIALGLGFWAGRRARVADAIAEAGEVIDNKLAEELEVANELLEACPFVPQAWLTDKSKLVALSRIANAGSPECKAVAALEQFGPDSPNTAWALSRVAQFKLRNGLTSVGYQRRYAAQLLHAQRMLEETVGATDPHTHDVTEALIKTLVRLEEDELALIVEAGRRDPDEVSQKPYLGPSDAAVVGEALAEADSKHECTPRFNVAKTAIFRRLITNTSPDEEATSKVLAQVGSEIRRGADNRDCKSG